MNLAATKLNLPTTQPIREELRATDLNPQARARRNELLPGEAGGAAALVQGDQKAEKTPEQIHQELMNNAQRLVAQTFFGTLLKQMHQSPFKSELFSGGKGGEAFSSMYDQHLADRMARASGRRLAQSIVRHLERRSNKDRNTEKSATLPATPGAAAAR